MKEFDPTPRRVHIKLFHRHKISDVEQEVNHFLLSIPYQSFVCANAFDRYAETGVLIVYHASEKEILGDDG